MLNVSLQELDLSRLYSSIIFLGLHTLTALSVKLGITISHWSVTFVTKAARLMFVNVSDVTRLGILYLSVQTLLGSPGFCHGSC